MSIMIPHRVSEAELLQDFAAHAQSARSTPLTITADGEDKFVLLSATEYARLQQRNRRVMGLDDFTEEDIALIEASKVPAEYDHLDAELADWKP